MNQHDKLGFNQYQTRGDVTVLYLERIDGSVLETLIDTEELRRLEDFGRRWFASDIQGRTVVQAHTVWDKHTGTSESIYLSRFLLGVTDPRVSVDYHNHDTLDNRKKNFIPLSSSGNGLHRADVNKNNTSGYLGVTWSKNANKWLAQITHNRKNKYLGLFVDKEEAARVVQAERGRLIQLERQDPTTGQGQSE